jgi:23S rRNA (cytidine1920-2'-O)/16S rRNA (cytidine1409-2'-O)-methyltransferase
MVRRGLAPSRAEARSAIERGLVSVAGRPAPKASTLVGTHEPLDVRGRGRRFVSRGGEKLDASLDRFGLDVRGADALDAGASTGGFTDCLLARGAARVIAVDVGYGQLAWPLREDPRVTLFERTNVRDLEPEGLPFAPSMLVADLSFISLGLVMGTLARLGAPGAQHVFLVKPQFESGRGDVGSGGVVRDPQVWRRVILGVARAALREGLEPRGVMASPLTGPAGNVEFLLWASRPPLGSAGDPHGLDDSAVDAAVAEGVALGGGS